MTNIDRYRNEDISIAIIDDHEVVLEGFRSFMEKNGLRKVEAFTTARELINRVEFHHFDIYIIDVELPDMEASELIDHIREHHSDAKIIIHTIHEEMWMVSKMTEKRVDGVIYKTAHLEQLLQAITTVNEGRQYYSPKFKKSQKVLSLQNDIPSPREIEVLEAIAKGYSTKEIASQLFISENTVENHRKSLFKKLHAHNMAELIVKSIGAGYINPDNLDLR